MVKRSRDREVEKQRGGGAPSDGDWGGDDGGRGRCDGGQFRWVCKGESNRGREKERHEEGGRWVLAVRQKKGVWWRGYV